MFELKMNRNWSLFVSTAVEPTKPSVLLATLNWSSTLSAALILRYLSVMPQPPTH